MATKIWGECSGASGSKYNLWLELIENFQSLENNSTNITISLKLKRNDGYSTSVYNLNENENYAKITINGVEKTSANLKIDTRNNVTVTLLSWTGNVIHNSDGTLSLSLGCTFTMSGTSLSGGTASGSYNCVSIPRATDFSFSKARVTPTENVTVNLKPASSEFTHTVTFSIGSYKVVKELVEGVAEASIFAPVEWLNAIPNSKTGAVKVTVKTYSGSNYIGSTVKYFKLEVPEEEAYLPDFSITESFTDDGSIPSIWDSVLKNISKVIIDITSIDLKYSASLFSCVVTIGSQTKTGVSNTFDLPEAGETKLTVLVTDTRGFSRKQEFYFIVDDYEKPKVNGTAVYRCDSSGTPDDNGTKVAVSFNTEYTSVRGLNFTRTYARYKKSDETEYSESVLLTSSPLILNDDFDIASSYDFIFSITDQVTKTPFEMKGTLPSANIPFNIKKGGKGAAFGCYAETDNELTVGYDLNVKGEINNTSLNKDTSAKAITEFLLLDIKNFTSLKMISFNVRLEILSNITANNLVELFVVNNISLKHTYPLPVHFDGYNTSSGVVHVFINQSGIVKILSATKLSAGTTININGIISY